MHLHALFSCSHQPYTHMHTTYRRTYVLPSTSILCTYMIQHSNVDLPFSWRLFRPLTELHSFGEEDPVISSFVSTTNSSFSVLPSSGTLSASTSHTFLCQFLPQKVYMSNEVFHVRYACSASSVYSLRV